ncbi:hypothetical protein BDR26DRAFT_852896, partial [Obelidium mucronatum]
MRIGVVLLDAAFEALLDAEVADVSSPVFYSPQKKTSSFTTPAVQTRRSKRKRSPSKSASPERQPAASHTNTAISSDSTALTTKPTTTTTTSETRRVSPRRQRLDSQSSVEREPIQSVIVSDSIAEDGITEGNIVVDDDGDDDDAALLKANLDIVQDSQAEAVVADSEDENGELDDKEEDEEAQDKDQIHEPSKDLNLDHDNSTTTSAPADIVDDNDLTPKKRISEEIAVLRGPADDLENDSEATIDPAVIELSTSATEPAQQNNDSESESEYEEVEIEVEVEVDDDEEDNDVNNDTMMMMEIDDANDSETERYRKLHELEHEDETVELPPPQMSPKRSPRPARPSSPEKPELILPPTLSPKKSIVGSQSSSSKPAIESFVSYNSYDSDNNNNNNSDDDDDNEGYKPITQSSPTIPSSKLSINNNHDDSDADELESLAESEAEESDEEEKKESEAENKAEKAADDNDDEDDDNDNSPVVLSLLPPPRPQPTLPKPTPILKKSTTAATTTATANHMNRKPSLLCGYTSPITTINSLEPAFPWKPASRSNSIRICPTIDPETETTNYYDRFCCHLFLAPNLKYKIISDPQIRHDNCTCTQLCPTPPAIPTNNNNRRRRATVSQFRVCRCGDRCFWNSVCAFV